MPNDVKAALDRLTREVLSWDEDVRRLPVTPGSSPAAIRKDLEVFDLRLAKPLPEVTEHAIALFRRHNVHPTHPRHFGLFNPATTAAGVVGDALVALYNPQVAAWWYSPVANEVERLVLHWFMTKAGYDPSRGHGMFTNGGSEANVTATLVALAERHPDLARHGVRGLAGLPTIYASTKAHDSLLKAVHMVGLGRDALRRVPCDGHDRMRIDALRAMIAGDRREGHLPTMVVATAGTTGRGAIDDLPALDALSRAEGLWFHVDAAWGGGALLSPRLRSQLAGIERADSITWDAHKWLPVPVGAGMFFRREKGRTNPFDIDAAYVPDSRQDEVDLYRASVPWSRRCMGLKVLLTLATLGEDGVAALADHQVRLAGLLAEGLAADGWDVASNSLAVVCFDDPRLRAIPQGVAATVAHVVASGEAWISVLKRDDASPLLRVCLTNHKTEAADLVALRTALREARRLVCAG